MEPHAKHDLATGRIADAGYGRSVATALSYDDAIERAKASLKDEGFGVLCEIDVAKTLREKIGADFPPYLILGACNPQLAHRALREEPHLGLLLPCNLVVQERAGETIVSAVDARALLSLVGNADLEEVADDVNARFARVLDRIEAA